MSSTALRKFGFCPWVWKHGKDKPRTGALDYGNLFETVLLLPETYCSRFVTRPAKYTTTGMQCPNCGSITDSAKCKECKRDRVEVAVEKDWTAQSKTCQALEAEWEAAGKIVVDQDGTDKKPGFNQAREAAGVMMRNPLAAAFIRASHYQTHVVGEWLDEATKLVIPCQCLIDLEPHEEWAAQSLGDLKTTRHGYNAFFAEDVRSLGYHVQAAFDLDMYNAATGQHRDRWALITSDNTHPWAPGTKFLSEAGIDEAAEGPGFIDVGRVIYRAMLAEYCHSLTTDRWREYDEGWTEIRPNPYKDGPAQERAIANAPAPPLEPEQNEEIIP
jgi:hypothetical protein